MNAAAGAARSPWPLDGTFLLVAPAVVFLMLFFIYPFAYGFVLSFRPIEGDWLANYRKFFSDGHLWRTLITTFQLALPVTILNVGLALPIAFQLRRKTRYQRWVTTLLVIPITLGTVLIAEGMLTYFGPRGWLSQVLQLLHLYDGPIRLTHNFAGVVISLVISGFPFAFLLILSYVTGIDPVLARAAATLGAGPVGPVPPHLPAAARAGARDHVLPVVRAGVLGVPLGRPGRRAVGLDARDLDRRL